MSDSEPIAFRPARGAVSQNDGTRATGKKRTGPIAFNRHELGQILKVYGRKVAAGEWRDYAIDMHREKAIFSVFRRSSEVPIYRIEKDPKLARRQGAYSVIAQTGLILKRGHDLRNVLRVLERRLELVQA